MVALNLKFLTRPCRPPGPGVSSLHTCMLLHTKSTVNIYVHTHIVARYTYPWTPSFRLLSENCTQASLWEPRTICYKYFYFGEGAQGATIEQKNLPGRQKSLCKSDAECFSLPLRAVHSYLFNSCLILLESHKSDACPVDFGPSFERWEKGWHSLQTRNLSSPISLSLSLYRHTHAELGHLLSSALLLTSEPHFNRQNLFLCVYYTVHIVYRKGNKWGECMPIQRIADSPKNVFGTKIELQKNVKNRLKNQQIIAKSHSNVNTARGVSPSALYQIPSHFVLAERTSFCMMASRSIVCSWGFLSLVIIRPWLPLAWRCNFVHGCN